MEYDNHITQQLGLTCSFGVLQIPSTNKSEGSGMFLTCLKNIPVCHLDYEGNDDPNVVPDP